ncbi:hypothetical protein X753_24115 [Mesorhizobium sp. LNJC399B00]|uniref:hypothetical protein n=1 Tax=unclassified Mesorhizobium TaxID=325217 RepID=UPI0003CDEE47|nr:MULTISPECIES: hypothetical protein [unclassified Mesorhizobium]ESY03248.1 hypothetical protein X753_24115 [Mesorhizobium sp. LNJC399B00]WJI69383.1 hypothetical protein NLY36_00830 [Mesorhizobium sp. C399B]
MRLLLLSLFVLLGSSAWAQVTTCYGDQCTIEENGAKRALTAEEVAKLKRQNARTALGNVECKAATDPAACEKMMGELFAQFPY